MFIQHLIASLIMFMLWSCSAAPPQPSTLATVPAAVETTISDREVLARQLQEKHDLAEALVQWKILRTIDPENTKYRNQVHALQKIINEEAEHHLATGLANFRLGAYDTARLSFLKVLALDPKRRDALTYLREIDERQARTKPNRRD